MLMNLPKQFPIEKLDAFTFGRREAQTDELLAVEECVCQIEPIRKFLANRHSIVVGDRGVGKTDSLYSPFTR